MQSNLKDFFRGYLEACDDLEEDTLELCEYEEDYVRDHPGVAAILSASTAEDRDCAWNAVQLEKCHAPVMYKLFADLIRFFDVKCMNDMKGTDISGTLKQMATDEKLPDENRRQAIRLWHRLQRASRARAAELIVNSVQHQVV